MIGCENCRNWSPKQEKCRKGTKTKDGAICGAFAPYPMKRKLDGVYFRVKRDGAWGNVCFTDMTPEERDEVIGSRPLEWWKSMADILAECLRTVGDRFDIVRGFREDDE